MIDRAPFTKALERGVIDRASFTNDDGACATFGEAFTSVGAGERSRDGVGALGGVGQCGGERGIGGLEVELHDDAHDLGRAGAKDPLFGETGAA